MDKPIGLSSHDVVARVRRAVGESKVGHAGTLDPLASGVLVVGIGQATRLLGLITLDDKRYLARISFGAETETDDAEGAVTREAPVPACLRDEGYARRALAALVGEQEQVPPAYSAVSVDGRRSYAVARSGGEVELAARTVTVLDASLVSMASEGDSLSWTCSFAVSKGTYIRAIARDLGRSLGTAAHLSGLIRTSSGSVPLDRCVSLDELVGGGLDAALPRALDPLTLLPYPSCELARADAEALMQGKTISAGLCPEAADGCEACLTFGGKLVSIASRTGSRLRALANFPQGIEGVSR